MIWLIFTKVLKESFFSQFMNNMKLINSPKLTYNSIQFSKGLIK